jgi:hypothetical protein
MSEPESPLGGFMIAVPPALAPPAASGVRPPPPAWMPAERLAHTLGHRACVRSEAFRGILFNNNVVVIVQFAVFAGSRGSDVPCGASPMGIGVTGRIYDAWLFMTWRTALFFYLFF